MEFSADFRDIRNNETRKQDMCDKERDVYHRERGSQRLLNVLAYCWFENDGPLAFCP